MFKKIKQIYLQMMILIRKWPFNNKYPTKHVNNLIIYNPASNLNQYPHLNASYDQKS